MRWGCSLFPVCLHMLFLLPECPPSCIPISPNNMESRESSRVPFVHCLQHFIPKAAFSSVQSLSDVWLFATPWTAASRPPYPSLTPRVYLNSCPLSWWCHPIISSLLSLSLPTFNLSQHQGLSNESVLHIRRPKYWSFGFSISSSNEYSGLTSFRMDWLDFLAVQGTLKSLLQHHSSKASTLQ